MRILEAEEVALVSGGETQVVQGESGGWLSSIAGAIRDFVGGDTSTPANSGFTGRRG